MSHPAVFRPLQARFLTIPQTPLCYWLRDRFFQLLPGPLLGDFTDVVQGIATGENARFVRFVWEVLPMQYNGPAGLRRWVPFEKGGGYGKWFGHHFWAVDREHAGARIKAFSRSFIRNEGHYFKDGWTYRGTARGSLGVRRLNESLSVASRSRTKGADPWRRPMSVPSQRPKRLLLFCTPSKGSLRPIGPTSDQRTWER